MDKSADSASNIPKGQSIFFGILLIIAVSAFFYKTIFFGSAISRLDLLYQLDLLYNPELCGVTPTVAQDPSTCTQSFPKENYVQQCIHHFLPPIWNELNGCGQPLIADLSNSLLHPIDLIVGTSNQYAYNLGITLKILLSAICAYLVFIRRGSAAWSACIASLAFALYARGLRIAELAGTSLDVPLVFLSFSLLPRKFDLTRILACSFVLACAYFMMHPEGFFIAVMAASFLWLIDTYFLGDSRLHEVKKEKEKEKEKEEEEEEGKATKLAAKFKNFIPIATLALFALFSIALVAPSLFSFLEFMQRAYSYKYTSKHLDFLSADQIPFYLTIPKIAYSLFPGTIVLLGIIPAFFNKTNRSMIILLLLSLLFEARPLWLSTILSDGVFSYVLPEYSFGIIMFAFCALAADGLGLLANTSFEQRKRVVSLVLGGALVLTPSILILIRSVGGTDYVNVITAKALLSSLAIVAVTSAIFLFGRGRTFPALSVLLVVMNLGTMWNSVHSELPITKTVEFPPDNRTQLISYLQKKCAPSRITACGDRLLPPNTSLMYGLADFRCCSPLIDLRYFNFVEAAGGKLGYCNMINTSTRVSKLMNVASVRYFLSATPISSADEKKHQVEKSLPDKIYDFPTGSVLPGLRLLSGQATYAPMESAIHCKILLANHLEIPERYQMQFQIHERDKKIWQSSYFPLRVNSKSNLHQFEGNFDLPTPSLHKGQVILSCTILDSWTQEKLKAKSDSLKSETATITLCRVDLEALAKLEDISSPDKRFKLVFETDDLIRIYENNDARPAAYLVNEDNSLAVESAEKALELIASPNFNDAKTVVLESAFLKNEIEAPYRRREFFSPEDLKQKIELTSHNNVESEYICSSKNPCVFVQTSLFYPGWKAYVDGKEALLTRANYLFRAVKVPAGRHLVSFRYVPQALILGCILSLMTTIGFCALLLSRCQIKRIRASIHQNSK